MVPSAAPDQIEAPLTSDMYPTASIVGTRHHAVNALVLILSLIIIIVIIKTKQKQQIKALKQHIIKIISNCL